jgi:hypothetical protein
MNPALLSTQYEVLEPPAEDEGAIVVDVSVATPRQVVDEVLRRLTDTLPPPVLTEESAQMCCGDRGEQEPRHVRWVLLGASVESNLACLFGGGGGV